MLAHTVIKNNNVFPIIKGQEMSQFYISFWKIMNSSITSLVFWQGNKWLKLNNSFPLPSAKAPPLSSWHWGCSSVTIYHPNSLLHFLQFFMVLLIHLTYQSTPRELFVNTEIYKIKQYNYLFLQNTYLTILIIHL